MVIYAAMALPEWPLPLLAQSARNFGQHVNFEAGRSQPHNVCPWRQPARISPSEPQEHYEAGNSSLIIFADLQRVMPQFPVLT